MKELSELSAPKNIKRKYLERDVQKKCVDWARARGYWARKFSSMTSTAEPDYLFAKNLGEYATGRLKFAVEFKAPGKVSTEAQVEEQETMRKAGWYVFECDDFDKFEREVLILEALYVPRS